MDQTNRAPQDLAQRVAELEECLARIGLAGDFAVEIPQIPEEHPLASLYVAVAVVAEHLQVIAGQRERYAHALEEQLALVRRQAEAILELSTPIIEVWDKVLVLPLIGTVDSRRAQQIIERMLESIAQSQPEVVIMDVTGVPIVDTAVAAHLQRTIEAARLLGTQVILTGVSPAHAQTLAGLGVSLGGLATAGSLKAGLRAALRQRGGQTMRARPQR